MKKFYNLFFGLAVLGIASCTYEFPEEEEQPPVIEGNADFSNYVAIGNSLTAGFQSNALFSSGQANSFPALLHRQMPNGSKEEQFTYFDIGTEEGFSGDSVVTPGGTFYLGKFEFTIPDDCPTASASPTPLLTGAPLRSITPYSGNVADLDNFGIPGIRMADYNAAFPGVPNIYATLNPYYGFIAGANSTSVLNDVQSSKPTFFTFWMGNNDILGNAANGGEALGSGNFQTDPSAITPSTVFEALFSDAIDSLVSLGARGVVINIPPVEAIPYFTTINNTLLTPNIIGNTVSTTLPFALDATQAGGINLAYQGAGFNSPDLKEGKVNYPVIQVGPNTVRQMDPDFDFLVLTTPTDSLLSGVIGPCDSNLRAGMGLIRNDGMTAFPIPDSLVLDREEVDNIRTTIGSYNTIIRNKIDDVNTEAGTTVIALLDVNQIFRNLPASARSISPGGYFSLDGVHPNDRGHAFIANELIKTINANFNSTLRPVDLNTFSTNELPLK